MTTTELSISRFLVEAKNPDGTLVFPEWGGCLHKWRLVACSDSEEHSEWAQFRCRDCGVTREVKHTTSAPETLDLFTWPSLGVLWEGMQRREDWDDMQDFMYDKFSSGVTSIEDRFLKWLNNPKTFPRTVAEWLGWKEEV